MSLGLSDPLTQGVYSRDYQMQLGQGPVPLKLIYAVTNTAGSITLNNVNSRQGALYQAGSPYIGRSVRKITGLLRIAAGAPSGNYNFTIRDTSDVLVYQSPGIDIASTLIGTFRSISVILPPTLIPSGGRIQVEYTAGDASNTLQVARTAAANFLDANTLSTTYSGSYANAATRTNSFTLWE